jgi:hypothetical protein
LRKVLFAAGRPAIIFGGRGYFNARTTCSRAGPRLKHGGTEKVRHGIGRQAGIVRHFEIVRTWPFHATGLFVSDLPSFPIHCVSGQVLKRNCFRPLGKIHCGELNAGHMSQTRCPFVLPALFFLVNANIPVSAFSIFRLISA